MYHSIVTSLWSCIHLLQYSCISITSSSVFSCVLPGSSAVCASPAGWVIGHARLLGARCRHSYAVIPRQSKPDMSENSVPYQEEKRILETRWPASLEVEHVQDFQFWHVALWRTHYNGCHIKVFSFPCYGHWIPNLSVICDQMHGNSLGIYPFPCILYTPFCSTTRQCTWFGPRI